MKTGLVTVSSACRVLRTADAEMPVGGGFSYEPTGDLALATGLSQRSSDPKHSVCDVKGNRSREAENGERRA